MLTSKSMVVKDENNGKTYVIARFITAHKKSCRKVMFSGYCLSGEGGEGTVCPGGSLVRETPHMVKSGRYAS